MSGLIYLSIEDIDEVTGIPTCVIAVFNFTIYKDEFMAPLG